jgi:hypothetical protein
MPTDRHGQTHERMCPDCGTKEGESMRIRGIVCTLCVLVWPALAAAQGYGDGGYIEGNGERSVIRPAGYGWRNTVTVPDGACGCAMPVRADCYDVCRPCGLRPLCFLKRVARTLDCLLPCNLCHGRGYRTGPLHGCVLGGRFGSGADCCGGCCANPAGSCFADVGCGSGPSCGCESGSPVPALSDPFQDDPLPPRPQPAREVRRTPTSAPTRSVMMPPQRTASHAPPRQTTAPQRPAMHSAPRPAAMPQRTAVHAAPRPATLPRPAAPPSATSPYKITTAASGTSTAPANAVRGSSPQSVLRQTAHERELAEPAPHWIDQRQARPIIRSQSPPETPDDLEIPYNPLRGR